MTGMTSGRQLQRSDLNVADVHAWLWLRASLFLSFPRLVLWGFADGRAVPRVILRLPLSLLTR